MFEKLNYDFKDGYYYSDYFNFNTRGYTKDFEEDVNNSLQREDCFGTLFLQDVKYYPYPDEVYEDVRDEVQFEIEEILYDIENHNDTISFIIDEYEFRRNRKKLDNLINSYSAEKFTPTISVLMDKSNFIVEIVNALISSMTIERYRFNKIKLSFSVFKITVEN